MIDPFIRFQGSISENNNLKEFGQNLIKNLKDAREKNHQNFNRSDGINSKIKDMDK
jgi:hypothetical protein